MLDINLSFKVGSIITGAELKDTYLKTLKKP